MAARDLCCLFRVDCKLIDGSLDRHYSYATHGLSYSALLSNILMPRICTPDAGACVTDPVGGRAVPLGLGRPVSYFPLTGGNLLSWPWGRHAGVPMQVRTHRSHWYGAKLCSTPH